MDNEKPDNVEEAPVKRRGRPKKNQKEQAVVEKEGMETKLDPQVLAIHSAFARIPVGELRDVVIIGYRKDGPMVIDGSQNTIAFVAQTLLEAQDELSDFARGLRMKAQEDLVTSDE